MRTLSVLAMAMALAIPGCLGEGTAAPDEAVSSALVEQAPEGALPPAPVEVTNESVVEAPEWRAGDAWQITSIYGGESAPSTLGVVAADGSGYTLATDNQQMATYDAVFDVSWVGRIRASDLAGAQQGQPVKFFDFPLSDGKTWKATWDGLEIALSATFNPAIDTSQGKQPGFSIVGMNGEEPYVAYDYVPALRWWSQIMFAEGYGIKVDRAVENWTGPYLSATSETVYESVTEAPLLTPSAGAFTIGEGQTLAMLVIQGFSPAHARALLLFDPAGQPHQPQSGEFEASGSPMGFFATEELPPTPGEWHIFGPALHHPEGHFEIRVHQVLVEEKQLA